MGSSWGGCKHSLLIGIFKIFLWYKMRKMTSGNAKLNNYLFVSVSGPVQGWPVAGRAHTEGS